MGNQKELTILRQKIGTILPTLEKSIEEATERGVYVSGRLIKVEEAQKLHKAIKDISENENVDLAAANRAIPLSLIATNDFWRELHSEIIKIYLTKTN